MKFKSDITDKGYIFILQFMMVTRQHKVLNMSKKTLKARGMSINVIPHLIDNGYVDTFNGLKFMLKLTDKAKRLVLLERNGLEFL